MFINKPTNNSQVVNVFTDRNVLKLNRGQIISLLQRLLQTVLMNTICRQFCIAILLLQEHYCKKHYCKNTTAHNVATKSTIGSVLQYCYCKNTAAKSTTAKTLLHTTLLQKAFFGSGSMARFLVFVQHSVLFLTWLA